MTQSIATVPSGGARLGAHPRHPLSYAGSSLAVAQVAIGLGGFQEKFAKVRFVDANGAGVDMGFSVTVLC